MAQKVLYWSMVHVSLRRMFSLWLLNEASIAVHYWWCCKVQVCPYDFLNIGSFHFWQRTVKVFSWIKLPLQANQLFPCIPGLLLLVTYTQYLNCVSFQRVLCHAFSQAVTCSAVKTVLFFLTNCVPFWLLLGCHILYHNFTFICSSSFLKKVLIHKNSWAVAIYSQQFLPFNWCVQTIGSYSSYCYRWIRAITFPLSCCWASASVIFILYFEFNILFGSVFSSFLACKFYFFLINAVC